MKKAMCVFLALLMILSLAACGQSKQEAKTETTTETKTETTAETKTETRAVGPVPPEPDPCIFPS